MEKKSLPVQLENQKVILRKHKISLAYAMYEEVNADRERLRRFLPWVDHMKSVDDEVWYINECLNDWEKQTMFDYGLFSKTGEYIGNIGVHNIQWKNNCCELGYWIVQKNEGRGYISSAVELLEETLFSLGFNRIEIRCDPHNARSAAVPKRRGYHYEGILRQSMLFRGEYRDTAVYSKLVLDRVADKDQAAQTNQ